MKMKTRTYGESCTKRGITFFSISSGQQGPNFSTVSAIMPAL